MDRRNADTLFKQLVALISGLSILALGGILIFVLVQGAAPFLFPTATEIRIVPEHTGPLRVNGRLYEAAPLIRLPPGETTFSLSFTSAGGGEVLLAGALSPDGRDLVFTAQEGASLSSPEAFVFTAAYPGGLPGLEQKLHLILPEPRVRLRGFLGGLSWRPTSQKLYGILPMILGSGAVSLGALLLALPPGILCALFMGEFLPEKAAALVRGAIELLAGIPSVVYGFFGLTVVVPGVKGFFGLASGHGLLPAAIILALMILPTIIVIGEVSLRAVPRSHREASLALGASRMQTAWYVALPHARSGVMAGVILGISRALGETMAVILVAGNSPQLIHSPLDSLRTLTATIALEMGYAQGRHRQMLFSIGVVLLVLIVLLNGLVLMLRRAGED